MGSTIDNLNSIMLAMERKAPGMVCLLRYYRAGKVLRFWQCDLIGFDGRTEIGASLRDNEQVENLIEWLKNPKDTAP